MSRRQVLAFAVVFLLYAALIVATLLFGEDDAGGSPRCDQHAGTGQCINPPVIWRPDYAG